MYNLPKKLRPLPADNIEFENAVIDAVNKLRSEGMIHVTLRDVCVCNGWDYTESAANRIRYVFKNTLHLTRRCRCVYRIPEVTA